MNNQLRALEELNKHRMLDLDLKQVQKLESLLSERIFYDKPTKNIIDKLKKYKDGSKDINDLIKGLETAFHNLNGDEQATNNYRAKIDGTIDAILMDQSTKKVSKKDSDLLKLNLENLTKQCDDAIKAVKEYHSKFDKRKEQMKAMETSFSQSFFGPTNKVEVPDDTVKFLRNICDEYNNHLATNKILYKDELTNAKKLVVTGLIASLDLKTTNKNRIDHFKKIFNDLPPNEKFGAKTNSELFSKGRDSIGAKIAKVIITLFTSGLAKALGLWKVKGEKVSKDIKDILTKKTMSPSKRV